MKFDTLPIQNRHSLLLDFGDMEFLEYQINYDEKIEVKIDFTKIFAVTQQDSNLENIINISKKCANNIFSQFCEEYSFYAPDVVIIPPNSVKLVIRMKKKPEPEGNEK